jgi:hypothetical protein
VGALWSDHVAAEPEILRVVRPRYEGIFHVRESYHAPQLPGKQDGIKVDIIGAGYDTWLTDVGWKT